MENFGRYTHAIVRAVPDSLVDAVGLKTSVDVALARRQQRDYVCLLQQLGLRVIELPALEQHPDCLYVEDCAVVCDDVALITRPGHPSRRGEVGPVREALCQLGLHIVEMNEPEATLDGGDVLFTGRELLVGRSGRTNDAGVAALAAAFPRYPCTPVPLAGSDALHLKSCVSMVGPDTIGACAPHGLREVLDRLLAVAKFRYRTVLVPERSGANCLFVNGTLVHRSPAEYPGACQAYADQLKDTPQRQICVSEMSKADAELTCCSILIDRTDRMRNGANGTERIEQNGKDVHAE